MTVQAGKKSRYFTWYCRAHTLGMVPRAAGRCTLTSHLPGLVAQDCIQAPPSLLGLALPGITASEGGPGGVRGGEGGQQHSAQQHSALYAGTSPRPAAHMPPCTCVCVRMRACVPVCISMCCVQASLSASLPPSSRPGTALRLHSSRSLSTLTDQTPTQHPNQALTQPLTTTYIQASCPPPGLALCSPV